MKKIKNRRGFTLIELLVVIAIISLLSTTVMVALNGARAKSRDAKRKSDIRQVQIALESYFNDNSKYPLGINFPTSPNDFNAGLAPLIPTYIGTLPVDPGSVVYQYYTGGQTTAVWYGIRINYETIETNYVTALGVAVKNKHCYVCGGSLCKPGMRWWQTDMCGM